ncbi:glycine-tRNA ligase 2 chloroplastic/mitochondrial-like, partial [Trifolium pratense]
GVMGRHYALRVGYSEQVVQFAMSDVAISVFMPIPVVITGALFEITLPRFSGDIVPKSDAGIVLAIADR